MEVNDNIFRAVADDNDETSFLFLDAIADERRYPRISERMSVNY
jgi:hypothetical protein